MISDLIIYIAGVSIAFIFISFVYMIMLIPKYRDFAKQKIQSLKEKWQYNKIFRLMTITWLETNASEGS